MTTPLPWSPSSLDDYINCPRSFHEKRVLKKFKEVRGEEALWGEYVHNAFQRRQSSKTPLPADLVTHEKYMQLIEAKPGSFQTENKIALTRKLIPCTFFDGEVWYRGVIDYKKLDEVQTSAFLVDYKTGKPHEKWKQLISYALHTFQLHASVQLINAQFYWTQSQSVTRKVWSREEIPELWGILLPDLHQYSEAFKTNTWQPRPSGLCNGWCPVTDCEFWRPRRVR